MTFYLCTLQVFNFWTIFNKTSFCVMESLCMQWQVVPWLSRCYSRKRASVEIRGHEQQKKRRITFTEKKCVVCSQELSHFKVFFKFHVSKLRNLLFKPFTRFENEFLSNRFFTKILLLFFRGCKVFFWSILISVENFYLPCRKTDQKPINRFEICCWIQ